MRSALDNDGFISVRLNAPHNTSWHSIMVTKLDVLDTFAEICVGIAYHHRGQRLANFPGATAAPRHRVTAALSECRVYFSGSSTANLDVLEEVEVE